MTPQAIKGALNTIAAIAAIAAAFLWYKASVVVVRPTETVDASGMIDAQITVVDSAIGEIDPFATGIEQSRWNKWGATAASIAALLQGVALFIPGN